MESRDRHNAISQYAIAPKSCSVKTMDFRQKNPGMKPEEGAVSPIETKAQDSRHIRRCLQLKQLNGSSLNVSCG